MKTKNIIVDECARNAHLAGLTDLHKNYKEFLKISANARYNKNEGHETDLSRLKNEIVNILKNF